MSNDFHVWFDPKKYSSQLNGESYNHQNGFQQSHSEPLMNNYNNNNNNHKNISNFGIGVPPPIVSSNSTQQHNYFVPQNNGHQKDSSNPLIDSAFVSPIAQIGINEAQKIVSNVRDNYKRNWFGPLRYYFDVNNGYVIRKLKILLFPYLHRSWSRKSIRSETEESYYPPKEDVNAPDLYIPSMAFITYILTLSVLMGLSEKGFQPDLLSISTTKGLVILGLEVLIIKLLFYLFLSNDNEASLSLLDIISYCGYKFVGLTAILLFGLYNSYTFYGSFFFFYIITTWFMIKTLISTIPQSISLHHKNVRNYVVLGIIGLEGIVSYFLCYMM